MNMIGNVITKFFEMIWMFLKYPLYIAVGTLIVLITLYFSYYAYLRYMKKMQPIPNNGDHVRIKKNGLFKEIWIAIKQLAHDNITKDPAKYVPKGGRIVCFVGRQGQGKTIAMARTFIEEKKEWPNVKIATNFGYKNQDDEIKNWEDLSDLYNGDHGYLIGLDECQILANCRDWKNFDPSIMTEICFQRKQNKVMFLSTQVFSALDKSFKVQTQEIHYCHTLFKCFTYVVVKEPDIDASTGEITEQRFRRLYFFGHTPEIRGSYETGRMIKKWTDVGFVDRSEQLGRDNTTNINMLIENKRKK